MGNELSQEEKDLLSVEELEALGTEEGAGEAKPDEGEPEGGEAKADEAKADGGEGGEPDVPKPSAPGVDPPFVLTTSSDLGTTDEIRAKIAELDAKFEDGDISLAKYNEERAEYVEAITKEKMYAEINEQVMKAAAEKTWKDAQKVFFNENQDFFNVRAKNLVFVDAVNRLLADKKSQAMTDAEILEEAKKEVSPFFAQSGVQPKNGDGASDEARRKAIADAAKAEQEKAAGVQTLARVPVSKGNEGVDKFDVIDNLTGLAYEEAVAGLSDAERAQYAVR